MIYVACPSSFGLGLKDGHVEKIMASTVGFRPASTCGKGSSGMGLPRKWTSGAQPSEKLNLFYRVNPLVEDTSVRSTCFVLHIVAQHS